MIGNSASRRAAARARHFVGEKGANPLVDYNHLVLTEGMSEEETRARLEFYIAKKLGESLVSKFPNRQWQIIVDTEQGVIVVMCPSVDKQKGYHLHIKGDTIAGLIPRVHKAAAEILERYNIPRSRIIDPSVFDTFKRNVRDDVVETTDNRVDAPKQLVLP